MIELGKYATTVLGAYGVSIVLLMAIIGLTIRQDAHAKRKLAKLERRKNG